jgi:hypothetical protein
MVTLTASEKARLCRVAIEVARQHGYVTAERNLVIVAQRFNADRPDGASALPEDPNAQRALYQRLNRYRKGEGGVPGFPAQLEAAEDEWFGENGDVSEEEEEEDEEEDEEENEELEQQDELLREQETGAEANDTESQYASAGATPQTRGDSAPILLPRLPQSDPKRDADDAPNQNSADANQQPPTPTPYSPILGYVQRHDRNLLYVAFAVLVLSAV